MEASLNDTVIAPPHFPAWKAENAVATAVIERITAARISAHLARVDREGSGALIIGSDVGYWLLCASFALTL
jgi:hypothetical protein